MEKEISSGAIAGILLIALVSTIGLGYEVFAVTADDILTGVPFNLVVLNTTIFATTSMFSWVSFVVALHVNNPI